MMNYFSKCSEVHLKINFVISEMKVYLVKFFLLNIHEALQVYLISTSRNVTNLLRIFNFFLRKLLASLSLKQYIQESVRHGDIKFRFSGDADTGIYWF